MAMYGNLLYGMDDTIDTRNFFFTFMEIGNQIFFF